MNHEPMEQFDAEMKALRIDLVAACAELAEVTLALNEAGAPLSVRPEADPSLAGRQVDKHGLVELTSADRVRCLHRKIQALRMRNGSR